MKSSRKVKEDMEFSPSLSLSLSLSLSYSERERERDIYIYIYIYYFLLLFKVLLTFINSKVYEYVVEIPYS